MFYKTALFSLYFGTIKDAIYKNTSHNFLSSNNTAMWQQLKIVHKNLNAQSLQFANQVHGTEGIIVTKNAKTDCADFFLTTIIPAEADFLITQAKNIGLAVVSADCLPIIIYDNVLHIAAIVHAGWKGSLQEIIKKAVLKMHLLFGTQNNGLSVFFGPSAKQCCYQINACLAQQIIDYQDTQGNSIHSLIKKDHNGLFFDLPGFNLAQLQQIGIDPEHINMTFNECTICNDKFFSYRRQKERAGRQMSVICLK